MSDADLRSSLDAVRRASASLAAFTAALAHEAAGRELPQSLGYPSTASWLRHEHRLSRVEARATASLGAALSTRPALGDAAADGVISAEQALVIGEALTALSTRVDASIVDAAEKRLIGDAETFGPAELRLLADRVLAHVAPEIAEEELRRKVDEAEARAHADRGLTLQVDRVTQQTRVSGRLTAEMGAILAAALEPLARRRPSAAAEADKRGHGASLRFGPGAASGPSAPPNPDVVGRPSVAGGPDASPRAGVESRATGPKTSEEAPHALDDRTASQRRADALIELCLLASARGEAPRSRSATLESAIAGVTKPVPSKGAAMSGPADVTAGACAATAADNRTDTPKPRFHINVTVDYDLLRHELGVGMLDNGQLLTPESVRRMACDARLMPAILGAAGQVLDLGRSQRTWTGAARRAVILRDRGCVFPACGRPPECCDIHHIQYWSHGGRTDLSNAALVCGFHHHLVHHTDWTLRMGGDGLPEVVPPTYVDPLQRPLRNTYHRRP
jgi:hypothetical protein